MKMQNILFVIFLGCWATMFGQTEKWKGQEPVQEVNTSRKPIQLQCKNEILLENGIIISNNFEGARLNGACLSNDTLISVLITAENIPINMSPWYAYKIWAEEETEIWIEMAYGNDGYHRYFPKLSYDGTNWENLDSINYRESIVKRKNEKGEEEEIIESIYMKLKLSSDTLMISAQEIMTNKHNAEWEYKLLELDFVEREQIGVSINNQAINALKIGSGQTSKIIAVLSRQHPPEVTGHIAMQSFIETVCSDSKLAKKFRKRYDVYLIPFVNPDGVVNGHWRHNAGGVDLNRDWQNFNQPETKAIRDYFHYQTDSLEKQLKYFIDFHSTFEDIYYTMENDDLASRIIQSIMDELPGYSPNIKSVKEDNAPVTSSAYFFNTYNIDALTFEIGDNTRREFVKKKTQVFATKFMEHMLAQ